MDKAKKQVEQRILTDFVSNSKLRLRVTAIRPLDPPDFAMERYIKKKFRSIGVEITRVINPDLKQMEAAQERIVEMARESFRRTFDDRLTVYVYFTRVAFARDLISLKRLASILTEIVTGVVERNKGYDFRVETRNVPLPPEFEKVTIYVPDDRFENWQPFGAFRVPHISDEMFVRILRGKEAKIANYPEQFDEHWLIMACNFGSESSHFQFSNLKHESKASAFDKVFVYKYRDDEVIKIKY